MTRTILYIGLKATGQDFSTFYIAAKNMEELAVIYSYSHPFKSSEREALKKQYQRTISTNGKIIRNNVAK